MGTIIVPKPRKVDTISYNLHYSYGGNKPRQEASRSSIPRQCEDTSHHKKGKAKKIETGVNDDATDADKSSEKDKSPENSDLKNRE